jgi:hypothetical protein
MTSPNQFVPLYVSWPRGNENDYFVRLNQVYTTLAYAINQREIAQYFLIEVPTGENWYETTTSRNLRAGFRTVYTLSSLTAPGTSTIAHGITNIGNYALTHIYGTMFNNNSGAPLFVPLPQAAPDDVAITVDGTNINLVAATGTYNGYSAIVVLEYVKTQ